MRTWQDFEYVTLATMPMFLFSATFFPITAFPDVVRWVVEFTPLYRGVVLCRELTTGAADRASLVSVVYLLAMGWLGLAIVRRRLDSCCSPESGHRPAGPHPKVGAQRPAWMVRWHGSRRATTPRQSWLLTARRSGRR